MSRMCREATDLCDETELSSDDQISRPLTGSSAVGIPRDPGVAVEGRDAPCVVVAVVASPSNVIVVAPSFARAMGNLISGYVFTKSYHKSGG